MSLTREITRRLPGISAQLGLACLTAYFAYHAVEGDRGLNAWWALHQKIELADATLATLHSQRVLLNFGRPDEIVILPPKAAAKP